MAYNPGTGPVMLRGTSARNAAAGWRAGQCTDNHLRPAREKAPARRYQQARHGPAGSRAAAWEMGQGRLRACWAEEKTGGVGACQDMIASRCSGGPVNLTS